MNEPDLKVGVVGCGHVAQVAHIPALKKIEKVSLVAICDANEQLAKSISSRFSIPQYHTDFSDMLRSQSLDVIHLCVPPRAHAQLAIIAMKSGCHVLVEKPMALTLPEADEMVTAAKENNVKLSVAHNELFLPTMMRVKSILQSGTLGQITGLDIKDSWPTDYYGLADKNSWSHSLPGGVFGEMLPHPIYIAQELLGNLEFVTVHTEKIGKNESLTADELRVILKGKSGIATITESCNWASDMMILEIYGTKMNIRIDLWGSTIVEFSCGENKRVSRGIRNLKQSSQIFIDTIHTAFSIISGRRQGSHETLIRAFVDSILNNTDPPITMNQGRETVKIYEQVISHIENTKTPLNPVTCFS